MNLVLFPRSCYVACILPAHYTSSRLKRAKMGAKLVPNGVSPQKKERERGGQFMGGDGLGVSREIAGHESEN